MLHITNTKVSMGPAAKSCSALESFLGALSRPSSSATTDNKKSTATANSHQRIAFVGSDASKDELVIVLGNLMAYTFVFNRSNGYKTLNSVDADSHRQNVLPKQCGGIVDGAYHPEFDLMLTVARNEMYVLTKKSHRVKKPSCASLMFSSPIEAIDMTPCGRFVLLADGKGFSMRSAVWAAEGRFVLSELFNFSSGTVPSVSYSHLISATLCPSSSGKFFVLTATDQDGRDDAKLEMSAVDAVRLGTTGSWQLTAGAAIPCGSIALGSLRCAVVQPGDGVCLVMDGGGVPTHSLRVRHICVDGVVAEKVLQRAISHAKLDLDPYAALFIHRRANVVICHSKDIGDMPTMHFGVEINDDSHCGSQSNTSSIVCNGRPVSKQRLREGIPLSNASGCVVHSYHRFHGTPYHIAVVGVEVRCIELRWGPLRADGHIAANVSDAQIMASTSPSTGATFATLLSAATRTGDVREQERLARELVSRHHPAVLSEEGLIDDIFVNGALPNGEYFAVLTHFLVKGDYCTAVDVASLSGDAVAMDYVNGWLPKEMKMTIQ